MGEKQAEREKEGTTEVKENIIKITGMEMEVGVGKVGVAKTGKARIGRITIGKSKIGAVKIGAVSSGVTEREKEGTTEVKENIIKITGMEMEVGVGKVGVA